MVVAGLWHGAALGFLIWGGLHGVFLILDKAIVVRKTSIKFLSRINICLGWVITQTCVFVAWIFFRNPNLNEAMSLIQSILDRKAGTFEISDGLLVLVALILSILVDLAEIHLGPRLRGSHSFTKGSVIGALVVVIFTIKSSSVVPFIYFGF
jgi:D-alanyl-lipoteichoic acid acyltransferase DltB (MBOAT superfamily)